MRALRETRQREQRLAKDKYTSTDYKNYQNNYGFGRDFLPFEAETKREKLEKARKREEYSKMIKERNTVINNDNFNYGRFTNSYSDPPLPRQKNQFFQQQQLPKYKLDVEVEPAPRKNRVK